ncbi:MAG TPA: anti-sigma factor [Burkholderiales bacterium]|nr:anti-sigma factor [Burkholderiales bacterium]
MKPEDATKLLHAYVDGELDPAASLELEAQLAADPSLRAAHEHLRALSAEIQSKADYRGAPEGLRARIESSLAADEPSPPARRHASRRLAALALTGIAAIALILAAVVFRPADNERLLQDILASHARATLGQRMMDVASSDRHTVKPWLNSRLPFSPPVADYASLGYELAGARVDYAGGRPVAVLLYKRRKHTIEVFVFPGADAPARAVSRDGLNLETFAQGGMTYWLLSDVAREDLEGLARLLRAS